MDRVLFGPVVLPDEKPKPKLRQEASRYGPQPIER